MASIISITVTYECDDCGEEWEEQYDDLALVDEDPEHADCQQCGDCGCTCDSCDCTGGECSDCGCGEDQGEEE